MAGFIKLYRTIQENDLWLSEPFTKSQAWIDLLMLANRKDGLIHIKNGEMITIHRGECAWSMERLAARWKWSRTKVKGYFEYLKKTKMIHQKNIPKTTIINILNYERYQENTSNRSLNIHQNRHQKDTIEEGKEGKENNVTILECQKSYGEYQNVCLTQEQYKKLLSICANENLLNELINSFSVNIEIGKERPYMAELPNAHYERLKSYYNYRNKYPQRFQEGIKTNYQSKEHAHDVVKIAAAKWLEKHKSEEEL